MSIGSVHIPTLLATALLVIGAIALFMWLRKKI